MTTALGRCPLCGGDKKPGDTTFAVDIQTCVVVVRNVLTLVCIQCGDSWIENPIAAKLEKIVEDARKKNAVVEVMEWQDVA